MPEKKLPRVFISYSWTTEAHKDWVVDLASRLRADGIDTVLDRWHLKAGQDKYVFMERMVNDPTIDKVLCLCDRAYAEKANSRKGGVGTESTIISQEVYEKAGQQRFVPVVLEHDEDGKPCVPSFFKSRIQYDLSNSDRFEEEYDQILRDLHDRPLLVPPPIGKPPAHLFEEGQIAIATAHKLKRVRDSLTNGRPQARGLISDYCETFAGCLEAYRATFTDADRSEPDQPVVDSIERFLPQRDDFVEFMHLVAVHDPDGWFVQPLIDGLEQMLPYSQDRRYRHGIGTDNYSFILYELFLYLIGTLIRRKRYKEAAAFLSHEYVFPDEPGGSDFRRGRYDEFNEYLTSLEEVRQHRLKTRWLSETGEMVKKRATRTDTKFSDLMQADAVLFVRPYVTGKASGWNPRCIVYAERFNTGFELFVRAASPEGRSPLLTLLDAQHLRQVVDVFDGPKMQDRGRNRLLDYARLDMDTLFNLEALRKAAPAVGIATT